MCRFPMLSFCRLPVLPPFETVHSFLTDVGRRLVRREGLRFFLYVGAVLIGVALVAPLLAPWLVEERARAVLVAGAGLAGGLALGFIVAGLIVPRRRWRWRGVAQVARFVGARQPAIASDLLSTVQLEPELARAPR